jgi:alkylation response protein AidB-like acyl-CoA dehydrogenase
MKRTDGDALGVSLGSWRPSWWSLAVGDGQRELADGVFRLYDREQALDRRRRCFRGGVGIDRELWEMLQRMGGWDLSVPGDIDTAVLVAYVGGLCLAPVEYALSFAGAQRAAPAGTAAASAATADGHGVISLSLLPVTGRGWGAGAWHLALCPEVADRFVLGDRSFDRATLNGRVVDLVDGTGALLVEAPADLESVESEPADPRKDWTVEILAAAEACGLARAVLHMAADYAEGRRQFDRPISSFQAIQHKLADIFLWTEAAELTVVTAGRVMARGSDWGREVWGDQHPTPADACVVALQAMDLAVRHGHQVMGGYGVTEDYDMHLFTRRSRVVRSQITAGTNPYLEVARQWEK